MHVERKNVSSSTAVVCSLVCVCVCVNGRRPDRFPIIPIYIYILFMCNTCIGYP